MEIDCVQRNNTSKFKLTLDRHNARLKLIYCLLPDPPSFSLPSTFKDTNPLVSSLLVICLGWCSNFVGSESGQKQSVKLLLCSTAQFTIPPPPPPPATHTVCIDCTFCLGRGERGGGQGGGQREGRGATVHKYCSFVHGGNSSQAGSNIQTTE